MKILQLATWALLALGCAPPTAAPSQRLAPPPASKPSPPPAERKPARIELLDDEQRRLVAPAWVKTVRATASDDRVLWERAGGYVVATAITADGAAWLLHQVSFDKHELVRIDESGSVTSQTVNGYLSAPGLMSADKQVSLLVRERDDVQLRHYGSGSMPGYSLNISTPNVAVGAHRAALGVSGPFVVSIDSLGHLVATTDVRFPSGEPSTLDAGSPKLAVTSNDTVVAGTETGIVAAIGPDGGILWTLGVRGAVEALAAHPEGGVVVSTAKGELARMSEGRVIWQSRLGQAASELSVAQDGTIGALSTPGRIRLISSQGQALLSFAVDTRFADSISIGPNTIVLSSYRGPQPIPRSQGAKPAVVGMAAPLRFSRELNEPAGWVAVYGAEDVVTDARRWNGRTWQPMRFGRTRYGTHRETISPLRGPDGRPWLLVHTHHGYDATSMLLSMRPTLLVAGPGGWREDASAQKQLAPLGVHYSNPAGGVASVPVFCSPTLLERAEDVGRPGCALYDGHRWRTIGVTGEPKAVAVIDGEAWVLDDKLGRLVEQKHVVVARSPLSEDARDASMWGSSRNDIWVVEETLLHHFDGKSWTMSDGPVSKMRAIWGSGPKDIWIAGIGVAHFDGQGWSKVSGPEGEFADVSGSGPDRVWLAGSSGVWKGVPWSAAEQLTGFAEPPLAATRASVAPAPSELATPADGSWQSSAFELPVAGKAPLRVAKTVASASDGTVWFYDGERVVEHDGRTARVVSTAKTARSCRSCVAPMASGRGWLLAEQGLLRIEGPRVELMPHGIGSARAVAATSDGSGWFVGAGEDDDLPHALAFTGGSWQSLRAPAATYVAVSDKAGEAWLGGGLSTEAGGESPTGEGIIVHWNGREPRWIRVGAGPQLAVTAVAPGEAWSAGVAGTLVHVRAEKVKTYRIKPAIWLRGAWARNPNDVWFCGDEATLLRWDGRKMSRVAVSAANRHAAFTAIAGSGSDLLITSPSGIFRVSPKP